METWNWTVGVHISPCHSCHSLFFLAVSEYSAWLDRWPHPVGEWELVPPASIFGQLPLTEQLINWTAKSSWQLFNAWDTFWASQSSKELKVLCLYPSFFGIHVCPIVFLWSNMYARLTKENNRTDDHLMGLSCKREDSGWILRISSQ